MPRLTEARRRDRETLLLAAAAASFAAHGFDATSIAGIARSAGVSDGLLYRYFDDKRALLLAVLARFFEAQIARANLAVAAEASFAGRLRALVTVHLQVMEDEPALCRLFLRQLRNEGNYLGSPIHLLTRRYTALLLDMVRSARAAGEVRADIDLRLFRDLVFGGMEHIGWHVLSGGARHDPALAADRLVALLADGAAQR